MKNMGRSLAVLLLAGILSTCSVGITSGKDVTNEKGLLESVLAIVGNGYTDEHQLQDMMKVLKTSCDKNAGAASTALDTAAKSFNSFYNCLQSGISTKPVANGDFETYAKESCITVKTTDECIKQTKEAIEPCLEPDERKAANVLYDLFDSTAQFICNIDGARIKEFYVNHGEKCYSSKQSELLTCVAEISENKTSTPIFDGHSINGLHGILELIPSAKNCTEIEKLQECSVKAFKGCEHSQIPAEIINNLFNSVKKDVDCADFLRSQALPSNVINILLLSAVTATMSLRFL